MKEVCHFRPPKQASLILHHPISALNPANAHSVAQCTHYLCPGTLSCVHFPHHCPCAWEGAEDKVEFGEGSAICGSKGGWTEGEMGRKVELARKGLL
jgi:hypothetical protein